MEKGIGNMLPRFMEATQLVKLIIQKIEIEKLNKMSHQNQVIFVHM